MVDEIAERGRPNVFASDEAEPCELFVITEGGAGSVLQGILPEAADQVGAVDATIDCDENNYARRERMYSLLRSDPGILSCQEPLQVCPVLDPDQDRQHHRELRHFDVAEESRMAGATMLAVSAESDE